MVGGVLCLLIGWLLMGWIKFRLDSLNYLSGGGGCMSFLVKKGGGGSVLLLENESKVVAGRRHQVKRHTHDV